MNKEEIRYLLKRYRYISDAIGKGKSSAFFKTGTGKERITIDDDIIKFSNAVTKALEKEQDDTNKKLLNLMVLEGKSDVEIFSHATLSRSSYYTLKESFTQRLFCLCIFAGLVSEDEI